VLSNFSGVSKSSSGRKGRRLWPTRQPQVGAQPFHCTFCWKGFSTKYSWRRHEESVHVQPRTWTCCPTYTSHGPYQVNFCPYCDEVIWDALPPMCLSGHSPGRVTCVDFCELEIPQELFESFEAAIQVHLMGHGHDSCAERPVPERTFTRQDNMMQHQVVWHRMNRTTHMEGANWKPPWVTEKYSLPPEHSSLCCPFCSNTFETWDPRAEHVATHFRDDTTLIHNGCHTNEPGWTWTHPSKAEAVDDAPEAELDVENVYSLKRFSNIGDLRGAVRRSLRK
jgi:hypothetical protein